MRFPPDFLKRLEYLSIVSKRVFHGALLAQRRTRQKGAGVEFADHREYTTGDDLRYLDWNVYARHDHLLLKRFQEEQDLKVFVLLDCSHSMLSGDPSKFDLARQLTAALAYMALSDLDRVSVVAFADGVLSEFPLCRGKSRIVPLMHWLANLQTSGTSTNLQHSVKALLHGRAHQGIVILISDLFDEQGFLSGLNLLRLSRFECHVVQLHADIEAVPNVRGDVELVDLETNSIRRVRITEASLREYQQQFQQHQQSVRSYCRKYAIGCTQASSANRFDDLVLAMMRAAGSARHDV